MKKDTLFSIGAGVAISLLGITTSTTVFSADAIVAQPIDQNGRLISDQDLEKSGTIYNSGSLKTSDGACGMHDKSRDATCGESFKATDAKCASHAED